MKNRRDLIRAFRSARISRREFVARAAEGPLGLTAPIYFAPPPKATRQASQSAGLINSASSFDPTGAAEILSQELPPCPLGTSEERNAGWMPTDVIEAA